MAEFDAAKFDAEAKRQEQQRNAESARQEQQRQQRRLEAEKIRARELQAAAKAVAAPPAVVVANAPAVKKEKPPALAAGPLLEHVLAGKWYEGGKLAEFLPTADTSCLKTGEREITCFSKDRQRVVKATELTFSLKAVLHNFADNGFDVGYTYHVSAVRDAASTGAPKDDYGLLLAEGWQQPSQSARCQLKEPGRAECRGTQIKVRDYVAR